VTDFVLWLLRGLLSVFYLVDGWLAVVQDRIAIRRATLG
jgi:hypothetical protein